MKKIFVLKRGQSANLCSIRHRIAYSVTRYGQIPRRYSKNLVYQQKERLEATNETEIAIPDTFENLPNQLKEITIFQISTNSREISTNYE
ncbi:hypothetical protein [Rossellomorea sp. BNER]|uniref:hypothetical protein n=1 Tax=Rossellomorea sp. BNER TaxID=2962031 RepID=UPI003AF1F6C3|nr:hypothetical protein [Rossellomorea sp. BNER]